MVGVTFRHGYIPVGETAYTATWGPATIYSPSAPPSGSLMMIVARSYAKARGAAPAQATITGWTHCATDTIPGYLGWASGTYFRWDLFWKWADGATTTCSGTFDLVDANDSLKLAPFYLTGSLAGSGDPIADVTTGQDGPRSVGVTNPRTVNQTVNPSGQTAALWALAGGASGSGYNVPLVTDGSAAGPGQLADNTPLDIETGSFSRDWTSSYNASYWATAWGFLAAIRVGGGGIYVGRAGGVIGSGGGLVCF